MGKIWLSIISVYAPTEVSDPSTSNEFYFQLQHTIKEVNHKDMLLFLGDFNARVGLAIKPTRLHGAHNPDKWNNNGERLLDFCNKHGLVITKKFTSGLGHIQTRRKEDVLNYILVNQKFRASIFDTRTHRQSAHISDHNPVVSKIRIDYKRQKIKTNNNNFKHNKPYTFNLDNKTIEKIKNEMKHCLHKRKHSNVNEVSDDFKSTIKTTITQLLPNKATKAE